MHRMLQILRDVQVVATSAEAYLALRTWLQEEEAILHRTLGDEKIALLGETVQLLEELIQP